MISNVHVRLIRFSDQIIDEKDFQIENGNSDGLIGALSNTIYDGGTGYRSLQLQDLTYDQLLFFTDGIPNLDKGIELQGNSPIYAITSAKSNDSGYLKYLSEKSGGSFINLLRSTSDEALESLTNVKYQYLGASFEQKKIHEVYPPGPVTLRKNEPFSIAGRIRSNKAGTITLNFGYEGKIVESRKIAIGKESNSKSISRLWAVKKVNELLWNSQADHNDIIALGKKYRLVTPYTSLIVLDRVEDYVRYKIEPPLELKKEYDILVARQSERRELERNEIIEFILEDYEDRIYWWTKNQHDSLVYVPKEQTSNMEDSEDSDSENSEDADNENPSEFQANDETPLEDDLIEPVLNQTNLDTTVFTKIIEGRIFDEYGDPLPGANVLIKGSSIGTVANVDGAYRIRVRENDTLVINFVGFKAEEISIDTASNLEVTLEEDVQHLSEVVVTAMGVQQRSSLVGSVTEISSHVQGRIAGVQIESADSIVSRFDPEFHIEEWEPDEPYIDSLKKTPAEDRYNLYLELRKKYGRAPSFYLAVGNFFINTNQEQVGFRILSNIVELDLENHELLKVLAHKYLQMGQLERSIFLFDKIAELRPDEPQSKRDLAIAHQTNGDYQIALDLFREIILTDWDDMDERFPLIKATVLHEMNNLISLHKDRLDLSLIPEELILDMPVDVRVVLDWNVLETDLDLWVTEPNGEKCSYKNVLTKLGGRLTEDFMDGYGPEEYLLKNAVQGKYKIEVDYFDERVQKVSGPVTLQVSIYTNYGRKNQEIQQVTMQLKGEEDVIEVGTFDWND